MMRMIHLISSAVELVKSLRKMEIWLVEELASESSI